MHWGHQVKLDGLAVLGDAIADIMAPIKAALPSAVQLTAADGKVEVFVVVLQALATLRIDAPASLRITNHGATPRCARGFRAWFPGVRAGFQPSRAAGRTRREEARGGSEKESRGFHQDRMMSIQAHSCHTCRIHRKAVSDWQTFWNTSSVPPEGVEDSREIW